MALLVVFWVLQARASGGALGIDRSAFDLLALKRRHATARFFNGVATDGPQLLVVVVIAAAAALWWKGHRRDTATLVVGFPLAFVLAEVAKKIAARPRPPHEVLYAGGYCYPSSSAVLAVGFVAGAIVLAPHLPGGGAAARWALIIGATVLAVIVSGLVIALRDHYLSDVIGGWGLGIAAFAAVALGADHTAQVPHSFLQRPPDQAAR